MGYLYCTGSENSLLECSRNVFSVVSGVCASHYNDVGVKCEGKKQYHVHNYYKYKYSTS